ncbi:histamine H2 receptor [Hydra vulgaris]|uniref:histamine H2 receptor n=1 Tax=Hydra vulgaris TaxID=6087 RepID=UPI001F5FC3A7|nr:histamine H2 receptor-like [Hydra vulgaris]
MALPKFFKLVINVCLYMNSTEVLYYLEPLSIISKIKGERCECTDTYTPSQLLYKVSSSCFEGKNLIYGFCEPTLITSSNVVIKCLTNHQTLLKNFTATCSPYNSVWSFYEYPVFSNYSFYLIYMIIGGLIVILTLSMNFLIIFAVAKSKPSKSLNAVIYAVHMALIDLSLGLFAQPMFLFLLIVSEEYSFHDHIVISKKTYTSLTNWYEQIDYILINAQFANLAMLSVERCIVVVKPFWYFEKVTYKSCVYSIGVVWVYTLVIFLFNFFYKNVQNVIYITLTFAYGIPTIIMVISYLIIMYELRKSKFQIIPNSIKNNHLLVACRLVKLVAAFIIFWIPFFICFMLQLKSETTEIKNATFWTKLLSYCHCFLDPVLYSISHYKIKKEIGRTILSLTGVNVKSKEKVSLHPKSSNLSKIVKNKSYIVNTIFEKKS